MAQEDEFLIKARIDFDKANSIKQIKDITKYAEENLDKVLSRKKQSKNLKKINNEWHELVDYQNKFYDITYYKDRRKNPVPEEVSGSYITKHYGISKEKLTELRKAQKLELDSLSKSNTEAKKIQDEKLKNQESYNKKLDKIIAESKYYTTLKDYKKGYENVGILNTLYGKQGVDISQGEELYSNLEKKKDELIKQQKKYNAELDRRNKAEIEWAKIINSTLSPKEIEIMEKRSILDTLKDKYKDLAGLKGTEDELRKIEEQAKKTSEELNKLTKVSRLGKLLNTIKRVGFYRIARNLFRFIENGFKQGIQNLAQFDSGVNETMSKLTSNFTTISNSVTLMVEPLIEILQPAVELITRLVANISSSVSYLVAQLKGLTTFTKVNADYMKDFSEATNSSLLSFDKFESLNVQDTNMFEETPLDEVDKNLKSIATTIRQIGELILVIGGYKLINWLISEGGKFFKNMNIDLSNLDGTLQKNTNTFSQLYDKINPIYLALAGIFAVLDSIISIKGWDDTTTTLQKWLDILQLIFGAIAAIAGILAAFLPSGAAKVVKAVSFTATLLTIGTMATKKIAGYADGGLVDKGSLFFAGEAGAELVTTMPSGQTGVTNIAQFKQAMVEAIDETLMTNRNLGGDIVLNIDGAEIARSRRFITEMNLKNASLNLR